MDALPWELRSDNKQGPHEPGPSGLYGARKQAQGPGAQNFIKLEEVKPVESQGAVSSGSRAEQLRMWWKDRYRDLGTAPEKLSSVFVQPQVH